MFYAAHNTSIGIADAGRMARLATISRARGKGMRLPTKHLLRS